MNKEYCRKHTLAKILAIVMLVGSGWCGTTETAKGEINITWWDPDFVFAGRQAEGAAILRAMAYWNEVITGGPRYDVGIYWDPLGGSALGSARQSFLTVSGLTAPTIIFNSQATWSTARNTQTAEGLDGVVIWNLEAVAVHEFAHILGVATVADEPTVNGVGKVQWRTWSILGFDLWRFNYDNHIYYRGTEVDKAIWPDEYDYPNNLGDYTFRGTNVNNVWNDYGVWANFLQVENGQIIGNHNRLDDGSSIVHPVTPWGVMNAAAPSSSELRPFFSEVELALMQDIGHNIDRRNFFGQSYYQSGTAGAKKPIINNHGFSARADGDYIPGVDNLSTFGIGLHVVGNHNDITQTRSLLSAGYAGTGIRIEGTGNIVRINTVDDTGAPLIVRGNGEEGVGVLICLGSVAYDGDGGVFTHNNATLINRGTIEATGVNGTGVWFNANTIKLDNTGKIDARRADGTLNNAIYISAGRTVGAINIMRGSEIIGNITNDGVTTLLTFGRLPDANGEATNASDDNFRLHHSGEIVGAFNIQTWGGDVVLDGSKLELGEGVVGNGDRNSTLNIRSHAEFNTLSINNFGGGGSILTGLGAGGTNDGRVTVNAGTVNNAGMIQNLARFTAPSIDNHNVIENNTLVQTNGSFADLDGLQVGIRNIGQIRNNITIDVSSAIRNYGDINANTDVRAGTFIDNHNLIQNNTLVRTTGRDVIDGFADIGLFNQATGEIRNNTTIDSGWKLRNHNLIDNNGTISVTDNIDNAAGATIRNTSALLRGWDLNNDGLIQTTARIDVQNITNNDRIDDTWVMDVWGVVTNNAAGKITNTGTMTVNGRIDNAGLIDTATLINVTGAIFVPGAGDINNFGDIRNVVTLRAANNFVNTGNVERFTTLNIGNNLFNNIGGFIDVAQLATMNVGNDGNNAGRLTVNGNANFGGTFTNQDGAPQGWVNGEGRIATIGGFFNNGVIAPGNSIGTLTIAGPFTNNAAGRFEIEIDPSHYPNKPIAGFHNDLVDVIDNPTTILPDGVATINGGFVDVVAPSNDKTVNPTPARYVGNTKYIFLDTEDGLTVNARLNVVNPPNLLLFDFLDDHDAQSYWLDVQRQYIYGPFGDTFNQIAVGTYIDDIGLDPDPLGDFFDVLVALDKLNSDAGIAKRAGISGAAKFALDQMSGAIYATQTTASITNTTVVNNTLADVLRRDAFRPARPRQRNIWALGYGVGGRTQFDDNAYGYKQQFGSTLIGVDRRLARNYRFGVFASYGEGQISSNLQERSKSKELLGGLFLRAETLLGYSLIEIGVGSNRYETQRTINFVNRRTQNEHDSFSGTAYFEQGLEFDTQHGKIQPFLGMQYIGMKHDRFEDRGANSLNLIGDRMNGHSLRSMLGVRAGASRGNLSASVSAAWMHECLRPYSTLTAQFSNPGMANFSSMSKYTVRGNDPGSDWVVAGFGLNYDWRHWRMFGGYNAYATERQTLHTGNAGIAFGW